MGRRMTSLHRTAADSHPTVTSIKAHSQVSVLIVVPSDFLLTLCSVGLSLYLQSRFLYTFDNEIIYVIKIHIKKIYIYIYLPVCEWSSYDFLHVGICGWFLVGMCATSCH